MSIASLAPKALGEQKLYHWAAAREKQPRGPREGAYKRPAAARCHQSHRNSGSRRPARRSRQAARAGTETAATAAAMKSTGRAEIATRTCCPCVPPACALRRRELAPALAVAAEAASTVGLVAFLHCPRKIAMAWSWTSSTAASQDGEAPGEQQAVRAGLRPAMAFTRQRHWPARAWPLRRQSSSGAVAPATHAHSSGGICTGIGSSVGILGSLCLRTHLPSTAHSSGGHTHLRVFGGKRLPVHVPWSAPHHLKMLQPAPVVLGQSPCTTHSPLTGDEPGRHAHSEQRSRSWL
mmetsp:Transcript_26647/g.82101  ORF Transcript_26647/g.82101 Transcript_26647/m.82101 type:complete len:293 (+) Transcript_26647:3-881(+)